MDFRKISFLDYKPVSQLVTKESDVPRSKFPSIDAHNHLRTIHGNLDSIKDYVTAMDNANVEAVIDLDGGWGDKLSGVIRDFAKYPDRFHVFCHVDFTHVDEPDFPQKAADALEDSVRRGAKGLKFFKSLGLGFKTKDAKYLPIDTPKLDLVWEECGEKGIPVLIHTGDPIAFFTPLDKYNERLRELADHPEWAFVGDEYYSKAELLEQRNRVIAKHPNTNFICAHIANAPENLALVRQWLDTYPNLYVDASARLSELGRQPYSARQFMMDYQDRIIFGTDGNAMGQPLDRMYGLHWRFYETYDEYFDVTDSHKIQGDWRVCGIGLPNSVLKKIYRENYISLIP